MVFSEVKLGPQTIVGSLWPKLLPALGVEFAPGLSVTLIKLQTGGQVGNLAAREVFKEEF